ncbi:MAG: cytochrome c biogenesis protein ResB [Deltaproteobacteria bacterium]
MKNASRERGGNPVISFLTSIRLAIFLLITLAVTSIVGTIIPQGEPLQFYLERYGDTVFRLIHTLDLDNTYGSWWFVGLLILFSVNLIACTLKRLPHTLALYRKDSLDVDPDRLIRSSIKRSWEPANGTDGIERAKAIFAKAAGKVVVRDGVDGGQLLLAETGKWSYWGLYILHSSILVILFGAIIGQFLGFKGNLLLFEGETADSVMSRDGQGEIPLGFQVRCNDFFLDFYENGAPKEYRSDLSIYQDGKEVLSRSIRVNSPLSYNGITFYQSSYQAAPEVTVSVTSTDGLHKSLTIPAFEKTLWQEAGLVFGILQYLPDVHGAPAARIAISNEKGQIDALWLVSGKDKDFRFDGREFRFSLENAHMRYMTGLQVKKDPGVWIVWLGCTALIFGFVIVFWVPHRRIWLWCGERDGKTVVLLAGQANKNQIRFEKDFTRVEDAIERELGAMK